jgi:hypothetical protein
MNSKNWGYKEFVVDAETAFHKIISSQNLNLSKTDTYSFVEYRNIKIGLFLSFNDSKTLQLTFKKYTSNYEYEEFEFEDCCLLKNIVYQIPICKFQDSICIKKGLEYLSVFVETYFADELQGDFVYQKDYKILKEEKYFLNKQFLFLPIDDEIKQKHKNNYLPNAAVNDMRIRLVKNNNYPEKFKYIYTRYLKSPC